VPDFIPKQVYKNRAEAFREFVQAQELPVSRATFFDHCAAHKMVQPDKTVFLSDLTGYVANVLKINAATGPSLGEKVRSQEMDDLELRQERAKTEKLEKENRKEDDRWMEVVDHETQMAAFAGRLEEALQQATALKLPELVHLCGGDSGRAAELSAGLEEVYAAAFSEAVRLRMQTLVFDEEAADVA
jgi:hypothetical protein